MKAQTALIGFVILASSSLCWEVPATKPQEVSH